MVKKTRNKFVSLPIRVLAGFCARVLFVWRLRTNLHPTPSPFGVASRAGEIFSSERSHRKKFSRHLEFFMQWKTGERKKVLPRG